MQPIETWTQAWKRRSRCVELGREAALLCDAEPPAGDSDAAGAEPLAQVGDRARAECNVHLRIKLEDPLALRLGIAPTHGDHGVRIALLARPRLREVRGEPLVGLLADRARVEDEHVRFVRRGRLAEAELLEHALDPLGVVSVHLAAEGRDVVALVHMGLAGFAEASLPRCACSAAPE